VHFANSNSTHSSEEDSENNSLMILSFVAIGIAIKLVMLSFDFANFNKIQKS
jgi:hypothetical protein